MSYAEGQIAQSRQSVVLEQTGLLPSCPSGQSLLSLRLLGFFWKCSALHLSGSAELTGVCPSPPGSSPGVAGIQGLQCLTSCHLEEPPCGQMLDGVQRDGPDRVLGAWIQP